MNLLSPVILAAWFFMYPNLSFIESFFPFIMCLDGQLTISIGTLFEYTGN